MLIYCLCWKFFWIRIFLGRWDVREFCFRRFIYAAECSGIRCRPIGTRFCRFRDSCLTLQQRRSILVIIKTIDYFVVIPFQMFSTVSDEWFLLWRNESLWWNSMIDRQTETEICTDLANASKFRGRLRGLFLFIHRRVENHQNAQHLILL